MIIIIMASRTLGYSCSDVDRPASAALLLLHALSDTTNVYRFGHRGTPLPTFEEISMPSIDRV